MSVAESEESRWPDLATASIRTQSIRSTVAQRSSSANEGCAATRSASFGGGFGSGTGLRCVTLARLATEPIPRASVWVRWDGIAAVLFRNERASMQSCGWPFECPEVRGRPPRERRRMSTVDELLENNRSFATDFDQGGLPLPP